MTAKINKSGTTAPTAIPIIPLITAITAIMAIMACDSPYKQDTLKWKTAIDIPLNISLQVGGGLSSAPAAGGGTVLNLGSDTIPLRYEVSSYLCKLTNHEADYRIRADNGAGAGLTLYGLIFQAGDSIANSGVTELYDILRANDAAGLAARSRVNLTGPNGLSAPAGGTGSMSMPDVIEAPLISLLLGSKTLEWRWLALVDSGSIAPPNNAGAAPDFIDIKLRLRMSGVNSFDSLLTM